MGCGSSSMGCGSSSPQMEEEEREEQRRLSLTSKDSIKVTRERRTSQDQQRAAEVAAINAERDKELQARAQAETVANEKAAKEKAEADKAAADKAAASGLTQEQALAVGEQNNYGMERGVALDVGMDSGPPLKKKPALSNKKKTNVKATKAKTKGALLDGLKSGALEEAVAKMDADMAAAEAAAGAGPSPLAKVFAQFDTDHSGDLDAKELKRALKALGLKKVVADSALKSFDSDGDGKISLSEWENNMHPRTKAVIMSKLNKQGVVDGFRPLVDIARIFDQLDTDASGTISASELKAALDHLGLTGLDAEQVLKESFDKDGDGVISLEEWKYGLSTEVKQFLFTKLNTDGLVGGFGGAGLTQEQALAAGEQA